LEVLYSQVAQIAETYLGGIRIEVVSRAI